VAAGLGSRREIEGWISLGRVTINGRPAKLGDRLVAAAREISRSGRSGIYDVRVTADDVVIAEFRGHSRTIGGTWLPVKEEDTR